MSAPLSHSPSSGSHDPLASSSTSAPSSGTTFSYPPSTPHLSSLLAIRSVPGAGRGVYARKPLAAGTLLEISPVLLFPAAEYEAHGRHTQLDSYTFVWRRGREGKVMALALGIGSLFNHHPTTPNVSYSLDHATHSIRYTLVRAAAEGEELCISYGAGRMWWEQPGEGQQDAQSDVDEDELLRIGSDMEEDERETETSTAAPAASTSSTLVASNEATRPRLWRITAAIDPATSPLTLMQVWALRVEPRNTELFNTFRKRFHSHPSFLASLEAAPDVDMTHLRTFRRSGTREAGQELLGLVCAKDEMSSREALMELLEELGASQFTPGEVQPEPLLLDVPSHAAPSKARLLEWTQQWPCAHRPSLPGTSTPCASGSTSPVPGGLVAGTVDRQADEAYWNAEHCEWARRKMLHTVELARDAKRRGELPISAHVTVPVQPVPERRIANGSAARIGRSSAPGSNYSSATPSRVATPDPSHASTSQQQGHGHIEADAHDTRISARNPIQHAVTNAIKAVAAIRAERDRERAALGLTFRFTPGRSEVRSPSPTVSSGVEASRSAAAPAAPARAAPQANGQDYLLNSLVLFTTHEPCVACCMSLVHSRVKAIFFLLPAPGAGGCCGARLARPPIGGEDGGPYAVQEQNGLNHKFDVWRYQGTLYEDAVQEQKAREELQLGKLDP